MVNSAINCLYPLQKTIWVVLCAVVIFNGCSKSKSLPNGYYILKASSGYRAIVKRPSADRVPVEYVSGNITFFKTKDGFVYGYIEPYVYADGHSAPKGYFVLNTVSGEVDYGLDKSDIEKRLNVIVKE